MLRFAVACRMVTLYRFVFDILLMRSVSACFWIHRCGSSSGSRCSVAASLQVFLALSAVYVVEQVAAAHTVCGQAAQRFFKPGFPALFIYLALLQSSPRIALFCSSCCPSTLNRMEDKASVKEICFSSSVN